MRQFAELPIEGSEGFGTPGVVRCIFDWDVPGVVPEYAPKTVIVIDITDTVPTPEAGWQYDFDTKRFTPPPVVE